MEFNLDSIVAFFGATTESESTGGSTIHMLEFADRTLKYLMWIDVTSGSIFLAADTDQPLQGCPMLEFGFNCSEIEIGPSAYDDEAQAIRFYEHRNTREGIRLTFTPRRDGNWYIWANAAQR